MPEYFTFLNVTDAPTLGLAKTKLMRAHVTKTNFRKRRRRLIQKNKASDYSKRLEDLEDGSYTSYSPANRVLACFQEVHPSLIAQPRYHTLYSDAEPEVRFLIQQFRPLIFPADNGPAGSGGEAAWINLLLSEPALVEASMSVATTHQTGRFSNDGGVQSDKHAFKAVSIINKKLDEPATALTDGVLGAVFVLSFNERLSQNEIAWKVHVDGLAQMIRQRRITGGNESIPSWFSDLLSYETINDGITNSPLRYESVVKALRDEGSQSPSTKSTISDYVAKLHNNLAVYYSGRIDASDAKAEINDLVNQIHFEAEKLGSRGGYLRAFSCALRIYLLSIWSPYGEIDWQGQVIELKHALEQAKMRLCGSIELTLWQFFVGATAAESCPDIREWFINKLQKLFVAMRVYQWQDVLAILEKVFIPNQQLLARFERVWGLATTRYAHRNGPN